MTWLVEECGSATLASETPTRKNESATGENGQYFRKIAFPASHLNV